MYFITHLRVFLCSSVQTLLLENVNATVAQSQLNSTLMIIQYFEEYHINFRDAATARLLLGYGAGPFATMQDKQGGANRVSVFKTVAQR